jgi:hypothetical protein
MVGGASEGALQEPDYSDTIKVSKMLGWIAGGTILEIQEDQGGYPVRPWAA